jgi:sterol O-acyltransferase
MQKTHVRLEFSRKWNIPVHHFLRRHVYFSSNSYFSTSTAMFITFFVSSLAHELVMSCIAKKFRGYGFLISVMMTANCGRSEIQVNHQTTLNVSADRALVTLDRL